MNRVRGAITIDDEETELYEWMRKTRDNNLMNVEEIYRCVYLHNRFNMGEETTEGSIVNFTGGIDYSIEIEYGGRPPHWNPTLRQVEDYLDSDLKGKLLQILNHCVDDGFKTESLDTVISAFHLNQLRYVCHRVSDGCIVWTFWGQNVYSDDENVEGSDELLDESDIMIEKKQLCQKGMEIIESLIETKSILSEGQYIDMCNILKKLYTL